MNNILYFAPMFSPKPQHSKYKDNLTFFKMYGNNEQTDYLGLIRFSDMIPVPKNQVSLIDITRYNEQYKMLLSKQYRYINQINNINSIANKAKYIYQIVMGDSKSKTAKFYKKICCNFKVLEEKYFEYRG